MSENLTPTAEQHVSEAWSEYAAYGDGLIVEGEKFNPAAKLTSKASWEKRPIATQEEAAELYRQGYFINFILELAPHNRICLRQIFATQPEGLEPQ
jgi:hypothetical protein